LLCAGGGATLRWQFGRLLTCRLLHRQTPTPAVVNVSPVDLCAFDGILAVVRALSADEWSLPRARLSIAWVDTRPTHSAGTVALAIRLAAATKAPPDSQSDEAFPPPLPYGYCSVDVVGADPVSWKLQSVCAGQSTPRSGALYLLTARKSLHTFSIEIGAEKKEGAGRSVQFRPQSVVDLSAALPSALTTSMIAVGGAALVMTSTMSTSTITVVTERPPRALHRLTVAEFCKTFGVSATLLTIGTGAFVPAIAADGALCLVLRQIPDRANITAFDVQTGAVVYAVDVPTDSEPIGMQIIDDIALVQYEQRVIPVQLPVLPLDGKRYR
jgi:hypothetical protein